MSKLGVYFKGAVDGAREASAPDEPTVLVEKLEGYQGLDILSSHMDMKKVKISAGKEASKSKDSNDSMDKFEVASIVEKSLGKKYNPSSEFS